jgi:phenylacetate-coenzyme A ligase PaaK-like adenylate-forming protein
MITKRIELGRNQKLSREQFEAKRIQKFRKLVRYAYGNSPFYRSQVELKGISLDSCVPTDFPPLTKQEVIAHFDQIVTDSRITKEGVTNFLKVSKDPDELFLDEFYVLHTSGTSGEIAYFVYSKKDWGRGFAQVMRAHKPSIKKIKQAFVGATAGHFAGISIISSGQFFGRRQNYDLGVFNINHPLDELIDKLNDYQPDTIVAYAGALQILAEQQHNGKLHINPTWIDSSGEVLSTPVKTYIESVFGTPVQNIFASSEFLFMGFGRQEFGGMVLLEDDLIFEIANDATYVTNLFNYTFPLIRYRLNDVLLEKPEPYNGWPHKLVSEIVGRMEQAPYFVNEKGRKDFINPIAIAELYVKYLRRFQMQVESENSFTFLVSFESAIDSKTHSNAMRELRQLLDNILSEKKMTNISYKVKEVEELLADPKTGKFRLIINAK